MTFFAPTVAINTWTPTVGQPLTTSGMYVSIASVSSHQIWHVSGLGLSQLASTCSKQNALAWMHKHAMHVISPHACGGAIMFYVTHVMECTT